MVEVGLEESQRLAGEGWQRTDQASGSEDSEK